MTQEFVLKREGSSVWASWHAVCNYIWALTPAAYRNKVRMAEKEKAQRRGKTLFCNKPSTIPSKLNLQWKVWLFLKKESCRKLCLSFRFSLFALKGSFTLEMNGVGGFGCCYEVLNIHQNLFFQFEVFCQIRCINNWWQLLSD